MTNKPPIEELHFAESPSVNVVPGKKTQALLENQSEVEGNTVSYPKGLPIAPKEGKGATIKDVDGNIFLDFFAGTGVLNVGHSNPYVLNAATEQLNSLTQTLDFPTEERMEFIETLNEIAPTGLTDQNRVAFGGPTGSDAIEASIKLCKCTTGGDGLIAFRGANHGQTAGALSLSGINKYKKYGPLLPNVEHVPYPDPGNGTSVDTALAEVRSVLEDPYSGLSNPAGIWVEPIQGAGGVIVPPTEFLCGLREIATDNDIPLVFDEIITGIGRTGRWFASDWTNTTPDIMTLGKPLGGVGLPLSGLIYRESLDVWNTGDHKGTFRGNVTAMRAGTAAIEYIQAHDLLHHARETSNIIRSHLQDQIDSIPFLKAVRGRGLLIGVVFGTDRTDIDITNLVAEIQLHCCKNGLLVLTAGRQSEVLRLMPPLVLTQTQAEVGTKILLDAIQSVTKDFAQ